MALHRLLFLDFLMLILFLNFMYLQDVGDNKNVLKIRATQFIPPGHLNHYKKKPQLMFRFCTIQLVFMNGMAL